MKLESLVIVDQHATVNALGPCTHRPSRQGSVIGSKYRSFLKMLKCLITVFALIGISIGEDEDMTVRRMTVMKS